jgi:hypothetical protein
MTFNTGFSRGAIRLGLCLLLGSPGMALSQTLPNLPVIPDISCGISTGPTTFVPAGGDFQTALNSADPGDIITLEAGATFTGPFTLPVKTGTGCITIRTSAADAALPAEGMRITPAYASLLPKIVSPGLNQDAMHAAYGAHHYKLIGLELMKATAATVTDTLLVFGDGRMHTEADFPHHIEVDRVYVHGWPTTSQKFCIIANSRATTIKNSYIADCKMVGFDTQAILSWMGGPLRIINNYLEGAGENVMIGGADPSVSGSQVPSDIEILNNAFFKPLTWMIGDPTYAGTNWAVKNLLEFKSVRRVLIDGNIFENCWPNGQIGTAIMITPRNAGGTAPYSGTEDITITNNIIKHATHGVSVSGEDNHVPGTFHTARVLIKNNLWLDIGFPGGSGAGNFVQTTAGPTDLTAEHNTSMSIGKILTLSGAPGTGLIFRNNITPHNTYGVLGDASGSGTASLQKFFPTSYTFTKNVIITNPFPNNYPAGNFNAANVAAVGFTDIAAGDYSLLDTSPYHNAGTDGADIGIDWIKLQAAKRATGSTSSGGTPPPAPVDLQIR